MIESNLTEDAHIISKLKNLNNEKHFLLHPAHYHLYGGVVFTQPIFLVLVGGV